MVKTVRQSNFELLRIISMVLILMSHCDDIFGLANRYDSSLGVCKVFVDWLDMGGQIGVGCFVLISGYYMIEQKPTIKKLFRLVGEVWFYTIGIWLIWIICNIYYNQISLKTVLVEALYSFFPILMGHYWFVTAYIILMILSPFLNRLIFSLNKKEYGILLACLLVLVVVLSGGVPKVLPNMFEGRLIPMLVMYFIAGYLRRFGDAEKRNSYKHLLIALIFYLILLSSFYFITLLGVKINSDMLRSARSYYSVLNSPFVVIICVELFIGFWRLDIKYNRIINALASCTFGVYLLHANRLLNGYLSLLFPIHEVQNTFCVFLYSIVSVVIIYMVGSLIDYIRKNTIEKFWTLFLDKYLSVVQGKIWIFVKRIYSFGERVLKKIYI